MPAALLQVWLRLAELRQGWPKFASLSILGLQSAPCSTNQETTTASIYSVFIHQGGEASILSCLLHEPREASRVLQGFGPSYLHGIGRCQPLDVAKLMCWQTGRGIKGCLITEQEGMSPPQQQSLGGGVSFLVLSKSKACPSSCQAGEQCSMVH